jgi:hypothetical protein
LSGVVLPASANTVDAMYADVNGVIDSIMAHPNVAPFISARLIRSLVTSNPTPNFVGRVAAVFSATGGDLRATLTAILTDPEARSFTITDGRLKDPILTILGLNRALGVPFANPAGVQWNFGNLSQMVLTPATVFSFYNLLGPVPGNTNLYGPEFGIYPPALAIQRANFIYGILNEWYSSSFPVADAIAAYQSVAANPAALVDAVDRNLMFGRMSPALRDLIIAATAAITDTSASGLRERARGALYLAAISSEYSVYSDTSVATADAVQPPTGLAITSLSGSTVSIGWRAPLTGPAATGYVLEGGVRPGEVLATIPIAGATAGFTFAAPPGSYYIRLRTVSGALTSRPSGEVRLYVGAPAGPTAPTALSAYGRNASLVLRWRNTFGGGEPLGTAIDVSQNGARVASVPLPLTDTWTYDAVPAGTYTFTVRATNAAGTSGSSNGVTLTFPLSGCSAPGTPGTFSFAASGRTVVASWVKPATGTLPTGYTLEARLRNANGSTTSLGSYAVTATRLSSPLGPGRYEVRVRSDNMCGSSGFTSWQSATVQ